ncbi:hypothetical protein C9374_005974 [Naegleria lovaniensis]|uniref:Uncharacterized protein n=1 Tax=Naegleria lovaniensis TaxID=51637 RepID=A0AA88KJJ1_NAELO|nr:uncharacterized protein C9374_005974 [Naegleria lovaniensis]KAG2381590.1 hypothetical protein C9374_005974 [Naegleria lovaniensis]
MGLRAFRERIFNNVENEKSSNNHDEISLLLLGPSGAGISTILKQLKLMNMHQRRYTLQNLSSYSVQSQEESSSVKNAIYENVLHTTKRILREIMIEQPNSSRILFRITFEHEENIERAKILYQSLRNFTTKWLSSNSSIQQQQPPLWTPEIVNHIQHVYNDSSLQQWIKDSHHRSYMVPKISESDLYFFSHLNRITDESFTPTLEDFLHAGTKINGIDEVSVTFKNSLVKIIDPNQAGTEQRKWIDICFQSEIDAIIFVIPISEFNYGLLDSDINGPIHEALWMMEALFRNNNSCKSLPIYLLFNKMDLFKEILPSYFKANLNFRSFYPYSYQKGPCVSDIAYFIVSLFQQALSRIHQNETTLTGDFKSQKHDRVNEEMTDGFYEFTNALDPLQIQRTFEAISKHVQMIKGLPHQRKHTPSRNR